LSVQRWRAPFFLRGERGFFFGAGSASVDHRRSRGDGRRSAGNVQAGWNGHGRGDMDGIHLLGEWYECPAHTPEFTRAETLRALCLKSVREAGLTIVGDSFHQFEPQGVTGTVLLAESHLAIHTWPEYGFVTVDVYVCNLATDNSQKAKTLFRALQSAMKPKRTKYQEIVRGGKDD
jgi:S-adenosylmethionine decarboxylase proenzyme